MQNKWRGETKSRKVILSYSIKWAGKETPVYFLDSISNLRQHTYATLSATLQSRRHRPSKRKIKNALSTSFFCQQKYKQALKTRQTHKRIVMQYIINTLGF